jgi:hypothetical protein
MKFRIFTVALAFVMAFGLVSCDKSGEEQSVNGSSNSEITHTAGTFDYEEMLNNIYLDGKKISFPETAKDVLDISPKYSIESEGNEYSDYGLTMVQIYSGEPSPENTIVELFYEFEHYPKLDDKIGAVYFADGVVGGGVYDFKIGDKVSEKEIIDFFGEPTEKTTSNNGSVLFKYEKDESRFLRFRITEEDVLSVLDITNGMNID